MASVRLEIHVDAFNAYRNSDTVTAALEEIAHAIAARANAQVTVREHPEQEPFAVHTVHNATRAVTFVGTAGIDGELAEATHRALSRAIG